MDKQRYQRHLQLTGFGEAGQQALQQSRVCIVGLGGLGCPAALYLAAAGIGQLLLVDDDDVSLSNLQRQVLFTEADIGSNKAEAARRQLTARNSDIAIDSVQEALTVTNAKQLLADVDLVLDCTDNFHSRYLINDVCHNLGLPWVYASVLGFDGQLALFQPGGACFRCLFPQLAEVPDCNQAGVLGAVPGTLGTQQALLAIRHLAGLTDDSDHRLHSFQGLSLAERSYQLVQSPDCPICSGEQTYLDRKGDYSNMSELSDDGLTVAAADFAAYVARENPLLIDVRPAADHQADNLGGINIPIDQLLQEIEDVIEEGRPTLVYCQMGKRSALAVNMLIENDIANVRSLLGGLVGQR